MKILIILAALMLLTACPSKPSEPNTKPPDTLKTDTAQRRPPIMARQQRLRINNE